MKKPLIVVLLAALILSASAIGVYSLLNTSPPSPSPTPNPTITPIASPTAITTPDPTTTPTDAPTTTPTSTANPTASPSPSPTPYINPIVVQQTSTYIIIKDSYGNNVNVTLPVKRIVCITSGITEILYAIGAGDKVVGRDSFSVAPNTALQLPIVASSSASPNTELIVELNPDLIIADTMLSNTTKATFENTLKVPVLIQSASQSDNVVPLINAFGVMTETKQTADDLTKFLNDITDLVAARVKTLTDSQKPLVYYEWSKAWYSASSKSLQHQMIVDAGGVNLAADQTTTYPTLSAEYVVERNPAIIVRALSDTNHNATEFQTLRQEVMARTGLSATKAVQNQQVYIMSSALRTGLRNPIGLITMAKWFHPDLFADMDPVALHAQLVQKFFGESLTGTFAYP